MLHRIKSVGYCVSTLSVGLLATVSWQNAQKSLPMTLCLIAGAATSVIGMFCRWITYEIEERRKGA